MRTCVMAAVFSLAAVAMVASHAQAASPVEAQNVWARATPPGATTGAVYLTLTSPANDKLVGASSPAAKHASVHEMRMAGNVMEMRPVEGGLALPAGKPVVLGPNGMHIMLEGLTAPLKKGGSVPIHLTFQNAPPLDVQAQVEAIGASGPVTQQSGGAAMPGMARSQ